MYAYSFENDDQIVICNEKTCEDIKKHITLLTFFLKETAFLTEAYILDYFVEKLWTKLPSGWHDVVKDFEPCDLEAFLNRHKNIRYQCPWPLSLLAFRASAFALALPRNPIKSSKVVENFVLANYTLHGRNSCTDDDLCNISTERNEWGSSENEFEIKSGQHKYIPEFCRRHVKPKKQHEIFRMAQVTNILLKAVDVNYVVDIGSGQGHLSRYLALCYNLNVAAIEADHCHISGAVSFDKQALATLKRKEEQSNSSKDKQTSVRDEHMLPHYLEGSMTSETSNEYLEKILYQAWLQNSCSSPKELAVLGLHTCGDLAATILKSFLHYRHLRVLLSVGCCYMKLTIAEKDGGYPLSTYLRSLPNQSLSFEAREMACHALEMYVQKLKETAPALKIHCYRATLEKCIVHHYPHLKHMGLRGVKHAELLQFSEYAERALSKTSCFIPKEFYSLPEIKSCLEMWKDILVFYSLRLITAPAIESLILLDRLLHLYEEGYPSGIIPLFDPLISPRNYVLVSAKCKDL